jgi:hypothetical protein
MRSYRHTDFLQIEKDTFVVEKFSRSLALERPNRYHIDFGGYHYISDGKTSFVWSGNEYLKSSAPRTFQTIPPRTASLYPALSADLLVLWMVQGTFRNILQGQVPTSAPFGVSFWLKGRLDTITEENGMHYQTIEYSLPDRGRFKDRMFCTIYFDVETHLIVRGRLNVKDLRLSETLQDIAINKPMNQEDFHFALDKGFKQVRKFSKKEH